MAEPKKPTVEPDTPPRVRRDRDQAADRPPQRRDYAAGADGTRRVDPEVDAEAADVPNPDKSGTGW